MAKRSRGSRPPAQPDYWVTIGIFGFLLSVAMWMSRRMSSFACRAYFDEVTRLASHPLENAAGPWWEGSSMSARIFTVVCMPGGLWRYASAPQVLAEDPKIFLFDDFLNAEECEGVLDLHRNGRSTGFVSSTMQGTAESDFRTSSTAAFEVVTELQEPLLSRIVERMHLYARMPLEHGETLQIARYQAPGGKYELHRDSDNSVRRLATALVYLNDEGLHGGDTIFPMASSERNFSKPRAVAVDTERIARGEGFDVKRRPLNELCAEQEGVLVAPKRGRLVLFYNLGNPWQHPNGNVNITLNAYHGSCSVVAGEKWVLQRWMHVEPLPDQINARDGIKLQ